MSSKHQKKSREREEEKKIDYYAVKDIEDPYERLTKMIELLKTSNIKSKKEINEIYNYYSELGKSTRNTRQGHKMKNLYDDFQISLKEFHVKK